MIGKIAYGYVWENGRKKPVNEDSLLFRTVKTKNGHLVVACICDGMGGVGHGELASGYVTEQLERWIFCECIPAMKRGGSMSVIKGKAVRFFCRLNQELFYFMRQQHIPLGTTASMLLLYEKKGYIFHIGDSRIYGFYPYPFLKSAAFEKQYTKDHKKEENVLTRCLGMTPEGEVDVCQFRLPKGECGFLLCTDGFYKKLNKKEKRCLAPGHFKSNRELERHLREIAKRLMDKGETDNISALYLKLSV